jgi:general secretion pathway protein L
MAKRLIGIDIRPGRLRIAVAEEEKGATSLLQAEERPFADEQEMLAALREVLGGDPGYGDRLATALSARDCFFRQMTFPFAEEKKIASAIAFELSAQLPVPVDDCTTDFQKPIPQDQGGFRVAAAAVRSEKIRAAVEPFDRTGFPLHILDLFPFALAAGMRSCFSEGILACLDEKEMTVALVREGRVTDFRLVPFHALPSGEDLNRFLVRESGALKSAAGAENLPLYLAGSGITGELVSELRKHFNKVEVPTFTLNGKPLAAEFIPAAALAMRAAIPEREQEFNFRRGDFALKSEWAALKKKMVGAGVLLALFALIGAGSAWLAYAQKAHRAEALKQEMVKVYKQTFPGAKAIVDVPVQMDAKIRELKKKALLFGAGPQGSALEMLREVSQKTPKDITVDVRDFTFSPDGVKLEGVTTSFDAINRLSKSLESSPLFQNVRIADAKMSLDGKQVDFRLNLDFGSEKEKSQ